MTQETFASEHWFDHLPKRKIDHSLNSMCSRHAQLELLVYLLRKGRQALDHRKLWSSCRLQPILSRIHFCTRPHLRDHDRQSTRPSDGEAD